MNLRLNPAFLLVTLVAIGFGILFFNKINLNEKKSEFTGVSENNIAGEVTTQEETQSTSSEEVEELAKNYQSFNQTDYVKAISEKKVVVLHFYSNWSPTFAEQETDLITAFNQLESNDFRGFRVNFTDNETSDDEAALAAKYEINDTNIIMIFDIDNNVYEKFTSPVNSEKFYQSLRKIL